MLGRALTGVRRMAIAPVARRGMATFDLSGSFEVSRQRHSAVAFSSVGGVLVVMVRQGLFVVVLLTFVFFLASSDPKL